MTKPPSKEEGRGPEWTPWCIRATGSPLSARAGRGRHPPAPLVAAGEPAVFDKGSFRMAKSVYFAATSALVFSLIPGPIVVDTARVRM
jgi:hypothetical protein